MTPERDNFDRVRRLLVLKRYEQPPPGYFHSFSREVILRIKDGETGERASLFERWFGDSPWVRGILRAFEARPALAGVAGIAICGLVLAGILSSEPEGSPMMVTGAHLGVLDHTAVSAPVAYPQQVPFQASSGTNGMLTQQLRHSIFNQLRPPAQLIGFQGSMTASY